MYIIPFSNRESVGGIYSFGRGWSFCDFLEACLPISAGMWLPQTDGKFRLYILFFISVYCIGLKSSWLKWMGVGEG